MIQTHKYLAGLCAGANALACCAACGLLFLMTGKVLIPKGGKPQLVTVAEATDQLNQLIERGLEKGNE
jgi:hypothetical protein